MIYWFSFSFIVKFHLSHQRNILDLEGGNATIAMFVDWLCNISSLVIIHSSSLTCGLNSKDALGIGLKLSRFGEQRNPSLGGTTRNHFKEWLKNQKGPNHFHWPFSLNVFTTIYIFIYLSCLSTTCHNKWFEVYFRIKNRNC
jgi:hypothetical protein